ncbi:MAG TPA: DUF4783 domain-containing protein [Chitinophagaceae bacterium]|nr:DUF4783 domain-containing protein [Chitinophagaceae bacterium]
MGLFLFINTQIISAQAFIVNISNGLKEGKAETISTYFDNTIDLSFSDVTNTYSKKQAEVVLQRFLSKIEPKSYLNNQKGNSAYNNSKFCIGTLATSNGNYKVYMFFILRKDIYYLKELRFEK